MKRSLLVALSAITVAASMALLAGCASETSDSEPAAQDTANTAQDVTEDPEAATKLTYKQEAPTVNADCVGCHSKFSSLAGIKADKVKMASEITAGKMPPGNKTFKSSTAGKNLVAWLKGGSDLK